MMDENCEGMMIREKSLDEQLKDRESRAKQELVDIQRAQTLLSKNPELKELLTIMARLRCRI